jgi:hypothetical protein
LQGCLAGQAALSAGGGQNQHFALDWQARHVFKGDVLVQEAHPTPDQAGFGGWYGGFCHSLIMMVFCPVSNQFASGFSSS